MRKKLIRNIFLFLVAFTVIAAIIGYGLWNKPHQNIKSASAISIAAVELYDSLSNEVNHKKSIFINKVVAVSGEVKQVLKNQQRQQVILLKTNISGGSVNCTMEEAVNNIKAGDKVFIKGICSGYIGGDKDMDLPGDVFLIRCYRLI